MGGDGCRWPDGYLGPGCQAQKTNPGPNSVLPPSPSGTHQEALRLNVRGPSPRPHFREEEAPWPREGKGLVQAHPGSLMAKPSSPNPLHILIPPSLVLIWQSPGVAAVAPEIQVGGNSQVRLRSLPLSLSVNSVYLMVSRMEKRENLENRGLATWPWASLCPLCKPPFSQLLTGMVQ